LSARIQPIAFAAITGTIRLPRHGVHNLLFRHLDNAKQKRSEKRLLLVHGRHGLPRIASSRAAIQAHLVGLVVNGDNPAEVPVAASKKCIEYFFAERHELNLCANREALYKDLRRIPLKMSSTLRREPCQ